MDAANPIAESQRSRRVATRRALLVMLGGTAAAVAGTLPWSDLKRAAGIASSGKLQAVWGRRGVGPGRLHRPRAIAVDDREHVYIVDMLARIQVFDRDGKFLRGWRTPVSDNGRPTGLSIDRDGNLIVADTHYFRVLFYTPSGQLLEQRTLGGIAGREPGQFGFITDCVQDSLGNYYVSEYGEFDRIQKFDRDGQFLMQWGGQGAGPGQFRRPQSLALDAHEHLWITDACNHRIQVYDAKGDQPRLVRQWGTAGPQLGQLSFPYGLALDGRGHVYICEFGNHRVQKLTEEGVPVASWGQCGRQPGELYNPWAIAWDHHRQLFVLDTYNHRVQRISL